MSLVPRLPISSLLMAHPYNAHHEISMLPMRAKWKQAMADNGNKSTSFSTKIDVGQCMITTRTVKLESSYTKLSIIKLVGCRRL